MVVLYTPDVLTPPWFWVFFFWFHLLSAQWHGAWVLLAPSCRWRSHAVSSVHGPFPPLQEQPNQVNYGNICTGLEVLSFLLTVLQPPAILSSFKPLQRGVAACMTCGNTKVLRAVHSLLSRLMSLFPTEPSTWLWPSAPPSLSFLSAWLGGPRAYY